MLETLLIFILIAALTVFFVWPEFSLYALAFFLPVIGWSFYFHGLNLPLIDVIAVLALVAFGARLANQILFKKGNPIKIKWPLFLPFAIFLTISIISSLLAKDPLYSLWYLTRWLILLYFAYIFLPYNLIKNGKILKRTVIALALSSLLVLASGYLSLYGQDWRDSFFRLNSVSWFGVFPFGENHNLIAEFLNVGALLFLVLREWTNDRAKKRWCNIAFVLTSLGIILTFSRAGWITLFLQVVIYFWYKFTKPERIKMIFIGLGLLLVISPLLWKMSQLQAKNESSTENRVLLLEISSQALIDRPYLGFGPGEFINLVDENIRFKAKYGPPIDSHGMLQKVLAESGLFGLAAWIFLLLYLLKIGYRGLKRYQRDNPWLLPLGLAAAGGLFFQFFNTSYYKGKAWLAVAVFLAAVRLLEAKSERYERNKKREN